MEKSDLKTGMRVETRAGKIYLVVKDVETKYYGHQEIAFVNNSGFLPADEFNEDLICKRQIPTSDIVKVYGIFDTTNVELNADTLNLDVKCLIWERAEPKEMTIEEIQSILGHKVKIVETGRA